MHARLPSKPASGVVRNYARRICHQNADACEIAIKTRGPQFPKADLPSERRCMRDRHQKAAAARAHVPAAATPPGEGIDNADACEIAIKTRGPQFPKADLPSERRCMRDRHQKAAAARAHVPAAATPPGEGIDKKNQTLKKKKKNGKKARDVCGQNQRKRILDQ